MTEHPMITAACKAQEKKIQEWMDAQPKFAVRVRDTTVFSRDTAVIAALQWLADPENLSDDVLETVVKEVDVSGGLIFPCEVKATITALANALIKEIGDG